MTTEKPDRLCEELRFILAHADDELSWALSHYIEIRYAGLLARLDTQGPVEPKDYPELT
jgi:hypothetical protein